MCGIILAKRFGKKPVAKAVIEAYFKQKTRGSEGFGYVAIDNGVAKVVRAESEAEILKYLVRERSDEILFHHRRPTSTDNHSFATHPIEVSNDLLVHDYLVVHNGVISNDDELKTKHEDLGFVYTTEHTTAETITWKGGRKEKKVSVKYNDSEALAIEIALYMEGKKTTLDFSGSAAVVFYQLEKGTGRVLKLGWCRNTGNPLFEDEINVKKKHIVYLRSLTGGTGVESGKFYTKDYNTGDVEEHILDIGITFTNPSSVNMGFSDRTRDYYERYYNDYDANYEYVPSRLKPGNRSVTIPLLPTPKSEDFDFDDSELNKDAIKAMRVELEEKIRKIEDELDFWRGEFHFEKDGSAQKVYREEMTALEIALKEAEDEYDDLISEYIPSPYSYNS